MTRRRRHLDLEAAGRDCACFSIRKAARAVTHLYDEALRPSGLRISQFTLLMAARTEGPITISRLAEVIVMDRTTLTRNLKPLQRDGLIEVRPGGEDRRQREVCLTRKGRAVLARTYPLWEEAQARMAGAVGRERLRRLISDLTSAVERVHSSEP